MFKFAFMDDKDAQEQNAADCFIATTAPDTLVVEPVAVTVTAAEIDAPAEVDSGAWHEEVFALTPAYSIIKATVNQTKVSSCLGVDINETDLVPGEYEGGFKLWEGGHDLASFLADDIESSKSTNQGESTLGISWQCAKVLELGCGHGLPGIVALLAGAEVHFQDFNKEVLETLTMLNVAANWQAHKCHNMTIELPQKPPARYFSGDWVSLHSVLEDKDLCGSYDVILTAETIYSTKAMQTLYQCIKKCLKKPRGQVILAAKAYYFGVGGGVAEFKALVRQEGIFAVQDLLLIDNDGSNTRELIRLTYL